MGHAEDHIKIISRPSDYTFESKWYEIAGKTHFWMQWRLSAFLRQLRDARLPLQERLTGVEIGCGHGVFRHQLEENTAWKVDGVELIWDALKQNEPGRGNLYLYDVLEQKNDFKEYYDFIVLFDILEHIEDTRAFLDACLFHLKPGGYLFINVPALRWLMSPYDTAAGHFRRYDKKILSAEFSTLSVELIDLRYWGFSLLPAAICRKFTLPKNVSSQETIRKGFHPPHPAVNSFFRGLMSIETRLSTKPYRGTSLLAVARKR